MHPRDFQLDVNKKGDFSLTYFKKKLKKKRRKKDGISS